MRIAIEGCTRIFAYVQIYLSEIAVYQPLPPPIEPGIRSKHLNHEIKGYNCGTVCDLFSTALEAVLPLISKGNDRMKESYLPRATNPGGKSFIFQCLVGCLLILSIPSVPRIKAQSNAKPSWIDGYWQLTAEFPDYDLDTSVRFKTAADARAVEGVALGPTAGRAGSFVGTILGNHLSLIVPGPLGEMRVDLTLSDNSLSGTWAAAELKGNIRGTRMVSGKPEPNYYPKYLRTVCQVLRDSFYEPRLNGVDIGKLGARYAEQLADVRDDGDFVTLIRRLLREFKSSHTDFFLAPHGSPMRGRTPPVTSRSLSPEIYYLRIRHFDPLSAQDRQDFNMAMVKALEEAEKSPSLIMDLRGNRGGNLGLVFRSLGHFLQHGQDAICAIGRAGTSAVASILNAAGNGASSLPVVRSSSNSIFGEILRSGAAIIRIDAEQKRQYQGRIVILVDEGCYSGCELFSAILRDRGRAILIGNRTGGEVLGSLTYTIAKNMIFMKKDTGWRLEIPVIDFRTIGAERIEGKGVKPDIEVPKGGAGDSVLAEALKYLGKQPSKPLSKAHVR